MLAILMMIVNLAGPMKPLTCLASDVDKAVLDIQGFAVSDLTSSLAKVCCKLLNARLANV